VFVVSARRNYAIFNILLLRVRVHEIINITRRRRVGGYQIEGKTAFRCFNFRTKTLVLLVSYYNYRPKTTASNTFLTTRSAREADIRTFSNKRGL